MYFITVLFKSTSKFFCVLTHQLIFVYQWHIEEETLISCKSNVDLSIKIIVKCKKWIAINDTLTNAYFENCMKTIKMLKFHIDFKSRLRFRGYWTDSRPHNWFVPNIINYVQAFRRYLGNHFQVTCVSSINLISLHYCRLQLIT